MKKFKYCYYVVYNWKKEHDMGYGSSCLQRISPLNTMEEIKSAVDYIKSVNGFDNVLILNFIRLKAEK